MGSTQNSNLTRGASIMVISVTLAKVLGLVYIFPLTRLIHDTGIGIYSNAYNLYIIFLTLSTAGFPTAMGKLVSERLALHKYADVEQIYRYTMWSLTILSVLLFFGMWYGAPLYSHLVAIKDPKGSQQYLTWSVRAVAPSLLVVPLLSGFRGYLQGFQQLEPSAYSQAIEQVVRVVAIVAGAYLVTRVLHEGVAAGAAAATFAAFPGALVALVVLVFSVIPLRRQFKSKRFDMRNAMSPREAIRALNAVAIPVSLGALVVPISGLSDSLTVQNFLMLAGYSLSQAIAQYGILSRQAMQLIQLPLAFAMAIGASVLPSIAHAQALRDQKTIETNISGTIRSMFFMTFPVAAALLLLAVPIDLVLFGKTEGAPIISSVSFMGIFSGLELVSTYMLQGLGKMYRPVRNMFIGIFVKVVLNVVLILPFGIMGAAIATTIGYLFSSTLNVLAVKKYGRVQFSVWRLAAPSLLASVVLGVSLALCNYAAYHTGVYIIHSAFWLRAWQLLWSIGIGAVVYIVASIRLKAVSANELRRVPVVGTRLSRFAGRVQGGAY
ncbi:polysaccharide biosynthesis protein [Alicyclobacillus tolerans]|uniref:putative polysaccharide biosynthesis protein n=1 Tax=Alicyclobacillus tolerans TaxID=90970 RepID=UPI001F2582FC|nr:polysaccharide biosynthesis protein [Alicyclobacillus tolerans]MCF8566274.1 polysaccharide biosynthesis protein [Alicyclobacillus tolerans]